MSSSRLSRAVLRAAHSRVHVRYATTALRMPAMSPTMTEGGITSWKKKEGEAFEAGDVLLEVETDKATIDVEAQDDGVMGKIVASDGSKQIPVGQIIAMLAEEGDDLASIKVPSDLGPEGSSGSSSAESQPEPAKEEAKSEKEETKVEAKSEEPAALKHTEHKEVKHPKHLLPSVTRLLLESDLSSEQILKLKGTGRGGMLTKGDVLAAMGKIQNAYGSAEKLNTDLMGPSGKRMSESKATEPVSKEAPVKKEAPLDAAGLRRLIVAGMTKATRPAQPIIPQTSDPLPLSSDHEFDSILAPYASLLPPPQPKISLPSPEQLTQPKQDEWAGLW